jgi:aspartate 1-decarboxylase
MLIKILRAKIHRATITQAEVDYVGSITIDGDLLDASGILPGECVLVADLTDGARFETYVIPGERGSGTICINGAAARLVRVGDKVIVMAFAYVTADEAKAMPSPVVLVDDDNRVTRTTATRRS